METFFRYLPVICVFIAMFACAVCAVYSFVTMPKSKQIAALKEWLKWAVIKAEKELGSGTGQLKLREVYNMALNKFPWLMTVLTFEQFSVFVDSALEWMRKQEKQNKALKEYIEGQTE